MAIENTSLRPHDNWVLGGNPKAIEQQEAQGQRELVASSQLPADGLTPEMAAHYNIQIVCPSKNDPLFVDVKLPRGMVKKTTDHQMWSDLVNEDGIKIAGIFYKAAFYDRRAFISWEAVGT